MAFGRTKLIRINKKRNYNKVRSRRLHEDCVTFVTPHDYRYFWRILRKCMNPREYGHTTRLLDYYLYIGCESGYKRLMENLNIRYGDHRPRVSVPRDSREIYYNADHKKWKTVKQRDIAMQQRRDYKSETIKC
jgi:hypothetical protein